MSTSRGAALANRVPGDRLLALRRRHADPHQGVVIALAVVADLAHVEAALLGQEGRVDHVHACPNRPASCPASTAPVIGFWLSCAAAPSTSIEMRAGAAALELADQRAELLGQRHIGPAAAAPPRRRARAC